jgi:hypothetical protein
MSLWLPLLDYARSYAPLVRRTMVIMQHQPRCVEALGLSRGQIAAFQFHARLVIRPMGSNTSCPWLIVDKDALTTLPAGVDRSQWTFHSSMRHPSDRNEDLLIYKRTAQPGS